MSTTLIQNKPLYEGLKVTREEYLDLEDDGFKYEKSCTAIRKKIKIKR